MTMALHISQRCNAALAQTGRQCPFCLLGALLRSPGAVPDVAAKALSDSSLRLHGRRQAMLLPTLAYSASAVAEAPVLQRQTGTLFEELERETGQLSTNPMVGIYSLSAFGSRTSSECFFTCKQRVARLTGTSCSTPRGGVERSQRSWQGCCHQALAAAERRTLEICGHSHFEAGVWNTHHTLVSQEQLLWPSIMCCSHAGSFCSLSLTQKREPCHIRITFGMDDRVMRRKSAVPGLLRSV